LKSKTLCDSVGDVSGADLRAWRLSRRKLSALRLPKDSLREESGDIEALAESIAQHGLLVPVLIEPDGTVRAGRRRLEAMRARDPSAEVECLVLPPGADPAVAEIVENVQRKELAPVEEARAYRAMMGNLGWSKSRLAREIGVSTSRVRSRLNLLEAPPDVQAKVDSGEASAWAVADAFSKRGREDGRAAKVSARLRRGGTVRARYTPPSVRVPVAALPEGVRAKVFGDRLEITVTLRDDSADLSGLGRICEAVRAPLAASGTSIIAALRAARTRVVELEGFS